MMEIINPHIERGRVRHALFDFDGTLSLIREGWQQIMIPLMVECLSATPQHESATELEAAVADYITRSTGIQTIYQMIYLAGEVERRGGRPLNPLTYKRVYVDRLLHHIEQRLADLQSGQITPDALMVPGGRTVLQLLRRHGVTCYLASGTDEPFVIDEARALGLSSYFAGIYGARDDYKTFSKKILIERIISEHQLAGPQLVVFGDGFVEIEDGNSVGGIAVGVASNEAQRSGIDEWKRSRLIEAGADIIVPDFSEAGALIDYLFSTASEG